MKLHVFNPENDLALACFSPHFIPPESARRMAADLSALPTWWAEPGDAVCVASADDACRMAGQCGGLCPEVEWVEKDGLPASPEVCPWGWSPLLVERMRKGGVQAECLPDEKTLSCYRDLSHRRHAVDLLRFLRSRDSGLSRIAAEGLCGDSRYCMEERDIVRCLTEWPDTILKAPWSGSGKGLRFGHGEYVASLAGWCRHVLRGQGGVVVEPLYHKVLDFAMEFSADADGTVCYRSLSVFRTDGRGAYAGNWVAAESVKEKWLSAFLPAGLLQALREALSEGLCRLLGGRYQGCLGVDMMLCRGAGAAGICVHPCVEINLRRTMGWVAADLSRYLADGAEACLVVDCAKDDGQLLADHLQRLAGMPCRLSGGRFAAGYLALTPVTKRTHYRAALLEGRPV